MSECDHVWETLEDGSRRCFECDLHEPAMLDLDEIAKVCSAVDSLTLEEKLLGAPRSSVEGVEFAPGKSLVQFDFDDDDGNPVQLGGEAIQVIRRDEGDHRLAIRIKLHYVLPPPFAIKTTDIAEIWFAGDDPKMPAILKFIDQDDA